jgi:hypothetical protein
MARPVNALRLVEYMKRLVEGAKGNVVSISLKKALKALGAESRAEAAAVKAALDVLASLGLLEAAGGASRGTSSGGGRRSGPRWRPATWSW